jgi:hypothetical protein
MKIEKRRFFPTLESLESIVALSGLSTSAAAAVVTTTAAKTLMLSGNISGVYHARSIPDAGKTYTFTHGQGKVSTLGHAQMTGNVQLPGLLNAPGGANSSVNAIGTLIIANRKGSLILQLSAPSTDNASSLPHSFAFTITGATGAYHGDTGTGWVIIQVKHPSSTVSPGGREHGTFHLDLLSVSPPIL